MDVVGPLKLGAAGAEYFLTIVDVYTRMTWVYVLPKKSDVAETVKTDWLPMEWKAENQANIGVRLGEVKRTGLEHVELPLELSSSSTITRQSPQMNGDEEEEEAISSKWLFKRKTDADGNIERYKSRLVAKGYQQQEKKDYNEVYAPVVKGTTLRTLFAAAAIKGWVVKQMDIVKWHWVRSMVTAGEVELHYVKTTAQPADMMTKRLVEQQHWKCCKLDGMALN
ncbi:hypothetical protein CLOP_g18113 [Closterium sp. NIES-67]|nr:hypothetical protein CLOP_g18113 [Closterium sp. NIES-67]